MARPKYPKRPRISHIRNRPDTCMCGECRRKREPQVNSRITCFCGKCYKCKRRAYMREWRRFRAEGTSIRAQSKTRSPLIVSITSQLNPAFMTHMIDPYDDD